jgi:hypothetical protein
MKPNQTILANLINFSGCVMKYMKKNKQELRLTLKAGMLVKKLACKLK